MGLAPSSLVSAYTDWLTHLIASPDKQAQLLSQAQANAASLMLTATGDSSDNTPPTHDRRFSAPAWQQWPFNVMYRSFALNQQWWHNATTGVGGVSAHHEQMASFYAKQWLDMFSPSNFLPTNPVVLAQTFQSGGANLLRGAHNQLGDVQRLAAGKPSAAMEQFRVGHEVAITKGKVVFSNHLIELIQYAPATPTVFARPILIVPSWILKFYILDLSPHNSLVRYLVECGHTVFMLSWKNPDASDRDLGMDDYLSAGVMAAINAIRGIAPQQHIQAVGYCLGGTLLSIAAAAMARDNDQRLQTVTLLAAETDFREPGELGLFIDDQQLTELDGMMAAKGYLDGAQMTSAFSLLHARELVWSRMEREYLMGEAPPVSDMLAWNADATRMPYRQHHEYLRSLFLNNDLAEGRYRVHGRLVALSDIRVPMLVLGTQRDNVSPWTSVYKILARTTNDLTFCLTSGGHNVGIVNPPGPGVPRSYQIAQRTPHQPTIDPNTWAQQTPSHGGSWWPAFDAWLASHGGNTIAPPAMGGEAAKADLLDDAPGRYVLMG